MNFTIYSCLPIFTIKPVLLLNEILWQILNIFFISGRSYQGINEEIFWVSIGMGIAIAVLITIALCYIMREKCIFGREYYITA